MGMVESKTIATSLSMEEIERVENLIVDLIPEIDGAFIKDVHIYIKDTGVWCKVDYFVEKEYKEMPIEKEEDKEQPASLEEPEYYTEVFQAPLFSDGPAMQGILERATGIHEDSNIKSCWYTQDGITLEQTITYFKKPEEEVDGFTEQEKEDE